MAPASKKLHFFSPQKKTKNRFVSVIRDIFFSAISPDRQNGCTFSLPQKRRKTDLCLSFETHFFTKISPNGWAQKMPVSR